MAVKKTVMEKLTKHFLVPIALLALALMTWAFVGEQWVHGNENSHLVKMSLWEVCLKTEHWDEHDKHFERYFNPRHDGAVYECRYNSVEDYIFVYEAFLPPFSTDSHYKKSGVISEPVNIWGYLKTAEVCFTAALAVMAATDLLLLAAWCLHGHAVTFLTVFVTVVKTLSAACGVGALLAFYLLHRIHVRQHPYGGLGWTYGVAAAGVGAEVMTWLLCGVLAVERCRRFWKPFPPSTCNV